MEEYSLPILFTEPERQAYRNWGVKYKTLSKIQGVFAALVAIGFGLNFSGIQLMIVQHLFPHQSTYWMIKDVLKWMSSAATFVTAPLLLTALVCIPVFGISDFIFNRMTQKPNKEKYLELAIDPQTLQVTVGILQCKKRIFECAMTVQELSGCLYKVENAVLIDGTIYQIGKNTKEFIYDKGHKDPFLPRPKYKTKSISFTTTTQLAKVLDGVLLGYDSLQKEQEWARMHGEEQ